MRRGEIKRTVASGGSLLPGLFAGAAVRRLALAPSSSLLLALLLITMGLLLPRCVTTATAFQLHVPTVPSSRARLCSVRSSISQLGWGVQRRGVFSARSSASRSSAKPMFRSIISRAAALTASTDSGSTYPVGAARNICLLDNSQDELARRLAVIANAASNEALDALIIGYDPLTESYASKGFKQIYDAIDATFKEYSDASAPGGGASVQHAAHLLAEAKAYVKRLEALLTGGPSDSSDSGDITLSGVYAMGFQRIINCLQKLGCSSPSPSSLSPRFPAPVQENYCLSLADTLTTGDEAPSITQRLNVASNSVARAMRYSGYPQRQALAAALESRLGHSSGHSVPEPSVGVLYGTTAPQPCAYARALVSLLRNGRAETLKLVQYDGPKSSATIGHSNISSFVPEAVSGSAPQFAQPPSLRLTEPFRSCLFRVLEKSDRPKGGRFDRPEDPECPL